jgi:SAM-dependent methyltransferase
MEISNMFMSFKNILNSKEPEYWDTIAETYSKTGYNRLWRTHSDNINSALFKKWLQEKQYGSLLKTDLFDEVLNTGIIPVLKSRANHCVGLDISTVVLKGAKARYPELTVVEGDVRTLPFDNHTFDVVISNSTLDHFRSKDEIFKSIHEIVRVLKKYGQLLITLDNPSNPFIAFRRILPFKLLTRLAILPYYVGATLRARSLCDYLEKAGLEVVELDYILHCPRVFAVAIARLLEKYASVKLQKFFLRVLSSLERQSNWPIRCLTGYYIAVKSFKRL